MEKSALQIARAAYQPKLPKALQGPVKVKEGAPTQSVGNQDEIKALFPNTYGMPVVEFVPAESENKEAINVGIILSGGQAPGGHNVISGLYDGVGALLVEELADGLLVRQVEFLVCAAHEVGVAALQEVVPDGRAHQSAVACHVYLAVLVHR